VLTDCTADIAMLLLLSVARRGGEGERQIRADAWKGWCPTHMIGTKVSGKTVGIIGFGRIGKAFAQRCHFGFGMDVVFYNRSTVDPAEAARYGARQLPTVEDVLAAADFVSLHCPGGAENRHLMNAARFAAMKPGAFLINTARGDVVDEAALMAALEAGVIRGAGLDVYEAEPMCRRHCAAWKMSCCCRISAAPPKRPVNAMGMKVVDNITAFFEGREPPDRVA
jgi:lactate dehydrogenase-like 2-hydroxyacid dehydrogenase